MRFLFLVAALLSRLPFAARRRAGMAVGDAARLIMARRRRIAARNLELAFPKKSAAARARLLRRHFHIQAQIALDRFWLLRASDDEYYRFVELQTQGCDDLLRGGRARILLVPHFAAMDMAVRLREVCGEMVYHHKKQRHPAAEEMIEKVRQRLGGAPFAMTPAALRALRRRRGALCYLPDMDMKRRADTVFAPFLGVPDAATLASLPRLARILDAEVLPCATFLTKRGYVVRVYPPSGALVSEDRQTAAAAMNAFVGARIMEHPAQYHWLHRRFKTRADGRNVYAEK